MITGLINAFRHLKALILIALVIAGDGYASATVIFGNVKNDETGEIIRKVEVTVADTLGNIVTKGITDQEGVYTVEFPAGVYSLSFAHQNFEPKTVGPFIFREGRMSLHAELIPKSVPLEEVVVEGSRSLVKNLSDGVSYDVAADPYARNRNMYMALGRLPLVNVNVDGQIMVAGGRPYRIYMNGRPFSAAQADPRAVLTGIPASVVSRIEVITNPVMRFAEADGATVINIITLRKALDGWLMGANGSLETQPKATGGLSAMGAARKVEWSVGYDYQWNRQQKQPVEVDYTYPDYSVEQRGRGISGNWQRHLGRAMMEWKPDGRKSFYADAHVLFRGADSDCPWRISETGLTMANKEYNYLAHNKDWNGTAESNVIFRTWNKANQELWKLGYRFTHNPDKQKYENTQWDESPTDVLKSRSETNGSMNEHTFDASYVFRLSQMNSLRVGVRQILRNGKAHSDYFLFDDDWITDAVNDALTRLKYAQNETRGLVSYAGYLDKEHHFLVSTALAASYLYNRLESGRTEQKMKNDYMSLLPMFSLTYRREQGDILLRYDEKVARPSILMLNPFSGNGDGLSEFAGNPDLEASRKRNLKIEYSRFTNKWMLQFGLEGSLHKNAIMPCPELRQDNILVNTYANVKSAKSMTLSVFANWRPKPMLSFLLMGDVSRQWLKSTELSVNQANWGCVGAFKAEYYPTRNWTVAAQVNGWKLSDEPRTRFRPGWRYSFTLNRVFCDGKLIVGLSATSPFGKFCGTYHSIMEIGGFRKDQKNWIVARSFGINVAYTISGGRKIGIKRNTGLKSIDQETGVK